MRTTSRSIDPTLLDHRASSRSALVALAALHHDPPVAPLTYATGFDALDIVLDGGIRQAELAIVTGKPGVGKTIAALQWARTMARNGLVSVYACYEHDETTLLTRLLACEIGETISADGVAMGSSPEQLVDEIRAISAGRTRISEAAERHPAIAAAAEGVARYADRLMLAASSKLDIDELAGAIEPFAGERVALFVDYVQKVPAGSRSAETDRVGAVAERLKALALEHRIAIIALSAADQSGLAARRVHAHHMRGAATLSYEADIILAMNDKLDIVSRSHVVDSPTRVQEFRDRVVVSVEKHRRGELADIEVEKDFVCARFEPSGRRVAERLWSEGSVER